MVIPCSALGPDKPSYCSYGNCSNYEAYKTAMAMCSKECKYANCKDLYDNGRCRGPHD